MDQVKVTGGAFADMTGRVMTMADVTRLNCPPAPLETIWVVFIIFGCEVPAAIDRWLLEEVPPESASS